MHRRNFSWRRTHNPYRILVSEVMLQQTQTDRVIHFYRSFLKKFPTVQALARAPPDRVLRAWQGLGYNRRAVMLKRMAKVVVRDYQGHVPSDPAMLDQLPGIGKTTAGAISAFAFGRPTAFIETNIRRVFIHHFFSRRRVVNDQEIMKLVAATVDAKNPREWYYALMDYGAYLGRVIPNPNRRATAYHRQTKFAGSTRELRGQILTLRLSHKPISAKSLKVTPSRFRQAMAGLKKDGLI